MLLRVGRLAEAEAAYAEAVRLHPDDTRFRSGRDAVRRRRDRVALTPGPERIAMLQGIDHLVVVTRDLDTAIAGYRALGFTVTPGGRHARASHNALVAFADGAYLELIAYWEDGSAHRWWPPLQKGGGLVDFCLATDDLDADLAAFRRAGVTMEDRSPGGRARPDGYQLRWSSAAPARAQQGVAPFIIEDDTPRAERVPRETTHANGVTGVGVVMVAVDDVPRAWPAGTRAPWAGRGSR